MSYWEYCATSRGDRFAEMVCASKGPLSYRRRERVGVALFPASSNGFGFLAALALLVWSLWSYTCLGVAFPETAYASQVKHPIPSLVKEVSHDQKTYTDQIEARATDRVNYRLTMTMPERVEDMKTVVYTVIDVPDAAIAVDVNSASATIVSADGDVKARFTPKASFASGKLSVVLGDLKLQYAGVSSKDRLIVRYDAQLSPTASTGRHPNVAKLVYDLGDGERSTAEVMALVTVPDAPAGGSQVVKTGDSLASVSFICLVIFIVSGLGLGYARRRLWQ